MKTPIQQAAQLIKRSQNILCITQKDSTTDGITSVLALQVLLDRLSKKACIVVPDKSISKLSFLTGYELIHSTIPNTNDIIIKINTENIKEVKSQKLNNFTEITISPEKGQINFSDISIGTKVSDFDLILALDMPNLESLGNVFEDQAELFSEVPIVSISTNPSYDLFGLISIAEPQKSATSEIIFDLIETDPDFNKYLDETISTILLTGIIAATGSFLDKNTTPSSLKAASILQSNGAIQSDIIEYLFKKKSLPTLKIWGKILNNIHIDDIHKIAWSNVTLNNFTQAEALSCNIDDIADNLLRFIKGIDISALVFEEKNQTIIQLRTANQSINLNKLKENFGGIPVKNGLDIIVKEKTIAEIESNLLEALIHFQNKRLNLDPQTKLQETDLSLKSDKTTHLDLHIKKKISTEKATAPKELPFSAPFQPHENTRKISKNNTDQPTKSEKKTYNPKKPGIPDWLKE